MIKPGRPSKISPEVKDRLLKAIAQGASLELACAAAGVAYPTVREWIARGERRHPSRKSNAEFAEFAEVIHKAIADSEMALLSKVRLAAEKNWKSAAWLLSHRWPSRWADNHRIEVVVAERVSHELEATIDRLERALPPDVFERVLDAIAADGDGIDEVTE